MAERPNTLTICEGMQRLPDEIKLRILRNLLVFPNGIVSERWPTLYHVIVYPLLRSDFLRLVPEILYSENRITIRPVQLTQRDFVMALKPSLQLAVTWPKPAVNQFIRYLEVQFVVRPYISAVDKTQTRFYHGLLAGRLGFENIQRLALSFKDSGNPNKLTNSLQDFVKTLTEDCPRKSLPKKLKVKISVAHHTCVKTSLLNDGIPCNPSDVCTKCYYHEAVRRTTE